MTHSKNQMKYRATQAIHMAKISFYNFFNSQTNEINNAISKSIISWKDFINKQRDNVDIITGDIKESLQNIKQRISPI